MTLRGFGHTPLRAPGPANRSGKRTRATAVFLGAIFALTAAKGAALSLSGGGETTLTHTSAFADHGHRRADIIDHTGELLATTVEAYSLFADPRAIWDPTDTAARLALVLEGIDEAALAKRLADRERAFVWIKRQMTPRQRQAVFALGLEGLGFRREHRRAYPSGSLAGHLLGYSGVDGNGLSGVELSADAALMAGDAPVRLTLDAGVQFVLESELDAAATAQSAIGGAGIVIEAATGNIRALASWPAFDPNRATALPASDPARFNRAVTGVYELGSVFKPLTVAAALDAGAIEPGDRFDTATPLVLGGETIADLHPVASPASLTTIIAKSSNLGTVRIAERLGRPQHWSALERFGLTARPVGDVPGSAAPILPAEWTDLSAATVSYGHGIAVSPLSMAAAYAALANGGVQMPLRLLASDDGAPAPTSGVRVLSGESTAAMLAMLRETVRKGTGTAADVPGYRVAGKTGTAEKTVDGVYDPDRNLNSFAAVFPADRPQYAILILLDEAKAPQGVEGSMVGDTAATTAAPLAGRVIERAAPLLGVMPRLEDPADQAAMAQRQSG
ncbi:MAG: penicillin-binding protein 2 [Pseudomonadota bacterium]